MGFQSCSRSTTVSAAVRLRPRPPTWVVSSMTGMLGLLLNFCASSKRCAGSTLRGATPSQHKPMA